MDHKTLRLFPCHHRAELLQGPAGRGMSRDVEMSNPAGPYFHNHKDIKHPERGCHYDQEVASQHGLRMIADKDHPPLRGGSRSGSRGHVTSDCAG
jgi:hypothetical protein